jgi:hypothetical protein
MGSQFLKFYNKNQISDQRQLKPQSNKENFNILNYQSNLQGAIRKYSKSKIFFKKFDFFSYFVVIKLSFIKEVFKSYRLYDDLKSEYYITYDLFNKIVSTIFKFDIPIICYTYLSKRIFDFIGKVN